MADDHINLKQITGDASGQIFAAVKTSKGDLATDAPTDPLVGVLVRTPQGNGPGHWSFVEAGTVADNHTRPIIAIDSDQPGALLLRQRSRQHLVQEDRPGSPRLQQPARPWRDVHRRQGGRQQRHREQGCGDMQTRASSSSPRRRGRSGTSTVRWTWWKARHPHPRLATPHRRLCRPTWQQTLPPGR